MKKNILLNFLTLFIAGNSLVAQVNHGGFGNVFVSPVYNFSPALQKELSSEFLIGNDLALNKIAFTYGGGGYTIRPRGFILGGTGSNYSISSNGVNGNARLKVSTGFFTIGHTILNKRKWMAFPYGGVGAFGSNFRISNTTEGKTWLMGTDSILPGKQAKYSTGGMAFDMGFGINYFVFSKTDKKEKELKGIVGMDAGVSFLPAFEKWENVENHSTLDSMHAPLLMNAYLRITIGFGVFYVEKNSD